MSVSASSGVILNVILIAGALGAVVAYYRRSASANWRDVAEQRMAAITDRDRQLADQKHTIDEMAAQIALLQSELAAVKAELAELKRHDITAVLSVVERLASAANERERENAALFADLRAHVFPMIEALHRKIVTEGDTT